eukprot:TRINITY_DN13860_c0_g1_i1.p1 TRINITY_DN13860_c0_g1~~TRINITY_DN13860_c0_g1_i1.p1  ORF type:complete len:317 (-),score=57.38 TRINITY_DN13860_c0_g1_i1:45-995(-)
MTERLVLWGGILGRVLKIASALQYHPGITAAYDMIFAVRCNLDIAAITCCDNLLSLVDLSLSSSTTSETMAFYRFSKLRLLLSELQQSMALQQQAPASAVMPRDDIPVVQVSRRKHNALLEHVLLTYVKQNMFDAESVTVFRPSLTRDSRCIFARLQELGHTGVTEQQVKHRLGNLFAIGRMRYFKLECDSLCPFCKTSVPEAAAELQCDRAVAVEQTQQLRKTRGFGNRRVQLSCTAAGSDAQPLCNELCFEGGVAELDTTIGNTPLSSEQLHLLQPAEEPLLSEMGLWTAANILLENIPAEQQYMQWGLLQYDC